MEAIFKMTNREYDKLVRDLAEDYDELDKNEIEGLVSEWVSDIMGEEGEIIEVSIDII